MAVAASEPIVLLSDSNMLQVSTNACWECFQWLSSISRIDVILALYFYHIFFIFGHNEQNFNYCRKQYFGNYLVFQINSSNYWKFVSKIVKSYSHIWELIIKIFQEKGLYEVPTSNIDNQKSRRNIRSAPYNHYYPYNPDPYQYQPYPK